MGIGVEGVGEGLPSRWTSGFIGVKVRGKTDRIFTPTLILPRPFDRLRTGKGEEIVLDTPQLCCGATHSGRNKDGKSNF